MTISDPDLELCVVLERQFRIKVGGNSRRKKRRKSKFNKPVHQ